MRVEFDLDPAVVAQIDALVRSLGIQATGEAREARRRAEVVRRLLLMWDSVHSTPSEGAHNMVRSSEEQREAEEVAMSKPSAQGSKLLVDQMEKELFRDTPYDQQLRPLFHYTQSAGLLGILKDKEIWATHYRYQNDRNELEVAEDLITTEARALTSQFKADSVEHDFLSDFATYHGEYGLTKITDVYIACLSEDGDLLSQWRGYGADGQGYSIGFDSFPLPQGGAADHVQGAQCSLHLYKCEYDEAHFREELVRPFLMKLAKGFARYWDVYGVTHKVRTEFIRAGVTIGLRQSAALVPRLKNKAFAEEKEWRLVLVPEPDAPTSPVRFRPGPRGVTPYLCAPLVGDDAAQIALAQVVLGPRHDLETSLKGAQILLKSFGYDPELVAKSAAPYRG